MSKKKKELLFIICVVTLTLGFMIVLFGFVLVPEEKYTITTDYGDTFNVTYHSFKGNSYVTSPNSELNWHYGGYIDKDDFIGLKHTDRITIYKLKSSVIFNDGNGFEKFDSGNIDEKPEVAQKVKELLLSDYHFYSSNFDCFLKSRTYSREAEQITDCIKQEKYDELTKYGLTKEVINDGYTLDLIKSDMGLK